MKHGHPFKVIGNAVRVVRERRGYTVEGLASHAGIGEDALRRMESGSEDFSVRVLERVAGALGLSIVGLISAAYSLDDPEAAGLTA